MLATLNSKQIVDEIVKDASNDPHDLLDISADVIRASRADKPLPKLATEFTIRPEPKIQSHRIDIPEARMEAPRILITPAAPAPAAPSATAPSVDTAVRATASDTRVARKRSLVGKWLGGAAMTMLFALGSAGATIVWHKHGDTAKQMIATWVPTFATSPAQATATIAEQPTADTQQAAVTEQTAVPPTIPAQTTPAPVQTAAVTAAPDATQSVQTMTRDLAAMAQQIEQLKANIAELKSGQEQMAREMTKPVPPKPVETRAVDPHAKLSALPPRPAPPPVRKPPKPVTQTYAPIPIAPPPRTQAAALPPPPPPPVAQPQLADDDGPVVRPPMPLR